MTTTKFQVSGMTCQSCVRRVQDALRLDGVARVNVTLAAQRVEVDHDQRISEEALAAAIRAAGYEASMPPGAVDDPRAGQARSGSARRSCCCGG